MTELEFYQQLDSIAEALKKQPEIMAEMQHPKYALDFRQAVRNSLKTGKPCLYIECVCPDVPAAPLASAEIALDVSVDALTEDEVLRKYTPLMVKIMKSMSMQLGQELDQL
ncbi:MAG TPA: hypothetical protein DDX71_03815 [Ruminococcus sp.]|nr:hypothetical protein [Ruminococcus sp.]